MFNKCFLLVVIALLPFTANSQSVGLVLSGGGSKGLTHIGVIKALEENRIPIDYVGGTSMGAIIGGVIIGIVEGFAANYLSGLELGNFHFGDIKDVTAFAIMIIVLMIRPHGIFGKEKVERV